MLKCSTLDEISLTFTTETKPTQTCGHHLSEVMTQTVVPLHSAAAFHTVNKRERQPGED